MRFVLTTQAISSYGIQLRLGNGIALSPLTVIGATNATPIVITTNAAHGIPVNDVDVVTIAGVGGNTAANGTWIIQALSATTFRLRGSVGNANFTTGGTATRNDTYSLIAELTNLSDAGLSATLVDCSAHDGNNYTSRIPTFLNGNTMRVDINLIPTNVVHGSVSGLEYLSVHRITRNFLVVFPDAAKSAWKFTGYVTSHRSAAPVAGVLTSSINVEIDGAPILSAA